MMRLAESRVEMLNPLFRLLNYFDTEYFFFILIPIIWLGFSYRWGLRIFYWFSFNNLVLHFAKHMIGWPRPSMDAPEIGMLHPTTNGFPSGGAETSMFLGGLLIYYFRTKLAWIIGGVYILLISFSRLYLGVHYPLDVLGGWILGLLMLALFVKTRDPLESWLKRKGLRFCLGLSLAIPLGIMIAVPTSNTVFVMGACLGIGLGTFYSLQYRLFLPKPNNLNEALGRSFVGIVLLFCIVLLVPKSLRFIQAFSAGLIMSVFASPICRWLMKKKVS